MLKAQRAVRGPTSAKTSKAFKASEAFDEKWGPVMGEQLGELRAAIDKGDLSNEHVKLMLWHELADIQPISLTEMPQKYLQLENGRLFYSLKSFALKQMDIMRREVYNEWQRGNQYEASKNLMSYAAITGGATAMTNEMRNAIFTLGADPIELEPDDIPEEIVWHMLSMTGLVNKFNVDKIKRW